MKIVGVLFIATLIFVGSSQAYAQFLLQTTGGGQRPILSAPTQLDRPQMSAINAIAPDRQNEDGQDDEQPEIDSDPTGSIAPDCSSKPEAKTAKPVLSTTKDVVNILDPALTLTGKCPKSTKGKDLAENIAIDMRNKMGGSPRIQIRKEDGKLATTEDWVAVDLLARTLYGEIGGSNKCASNDGYFEAVGRVIMNRAEFMNDPNHEKHTNFFKSETSVKNQYARAAISPHEFQVWQDESRYVICPASEIQKTYKDKSGEVIASTRDKDYIRWFAALQTASDMIFKENSFKCKTKNIKSLFYTKSSLAPGKNFVHVRGAKIGSQTIDNSDCVQLWDSPNAPFQPAPTAGCK